MFKVEPFKWVNPMERHGPTDPSFISNMHEEMMLHGGRWEYFRKFDFEFCSVKALSQECLLVKYEIHVLSYVRSEFFSTFSNIHSEIPIGKVYG
jgi:hypothetical protein